MVPQWSQHYTGPTIINGGSLATGSPDFGNGFVTNGGLPSGLGASSSAAANLVITNGGSLILEGPAASTDRLFTLGPGGGALSDLGTYTTGPITFSNPGAIALSGTNTARTLVLNSTGSQSPHAQSSAGRQRHRRQLAHQVGFWHLATQRCEHLFRRYTIEQGTLVAANNSAVGSGAVTLDGGTLNVAAGITFGNSLNLTVNGGTLAGNGSFSNPLTLGAGVTLAPGNSPGALPFLSGLTLTTVAPWKSRCMLLPALPARTGISSM